MWMTESEIVSSYLHAEKPQLQIQILSELNACSKKDILAILHRSDRVKSSVHGGGAGCQSRAA